MTQTADTDDTDALTLGADFEASEGAVNGDTTTKHGCRNVRLEAGRKGDSKLGRSSPILGKTTS